MARNRPITPAYRRAVALRVIVAVLLGFAFASGTSLAFTALLVATGAAARGDAAHSMTILTWLLWAGIAMAAFHVSRIGRLAVGLAAASVLLIALGFWLGWG